MTAKYEYKDTSIRTYDSSGKTSSLEVLDQIYGDVSSVVMPNGQEIKYCYYPSGALHSIVTSLDKTLAYNKFSYTKGLLTQIETNDGKRYLFEYDGFGNTKHVKYNGALLETYEYRNNCDYAMVEAMSAGANKESYYNYTKRMLPNGFQEKCVFNKNGQMIKKYEIDIIQSTERLMVEVVYHVNGNISEVKDYSRC